MQELTFWAPGHIIPSLYCVFWGKRIWGQLHFQILKDYLDVDRPMPSKKEFESFYFLVPKIRIVKLRPFPRPAGVVAAE